MVENEDDLDFVEETRRMLETAPICEPIEDETVGRCHWSRTGWAIYRADGACTCRPTFPSNKREAT